MLRLKQQAAFSQRKAFAEGTFRNLKCQWVKYLKFCEYFQLIALPASSSVLTWYTQYISRDFKSHATIVAYLSGTKTLHKLLSLSTKGFLGFQLQLTLQGLRRLNKHKVKRAKPMTPAILRRIYTVLNHNNQEHVVFWAICITGFFLLFRKSNLIPDTKNGFEPGKQLRKSDIVFTKNNAVVGIRWAKNEQFSRELLTFPLPRLGNSVLCPVQAIKRVFQVIGSDPDQHLFALKDGSSFTYKQFQSMLRHVLRLAEVPEPQAFKSHSLRRGGTTFLFLCGIPGPVIQVLGSWRSDAYLKYIEFPLETRTAASELMKLRILQGERRVRSLHLA